jgi:hypothetical protein
MSGSGGWEEGMGRGVEVQWCSGMCGEGCEALKA